MIRATRPAAFAAALLLLSSVPAAAHKVIAGVFPAGDSIEGEIALSNGAPGADALVEVFGPDGAKLGETRTDADGFFTWTPTQAVTHRFRSDLGAGHVAVVEMPAGEVAALLKSPAAAPAASAAAAPAAAPAANGAAPVAPVVVASLSDEEKDQIAALLRDEIRPLRREIAAYKEKNDLQTILGGIGYIAGLFGLGFYLAAKRRLERADP